MIDYQIPLWAIQVWREVATLSIWIAGLSSLFAHIWSSRILQVEKHKFDQALHTSSKQFEQKLNLATNSINRYSEVQFNKTLELWSSLCDLQNAADDLWDTATEAEVRLFAIQIRSTRLAVKRSALILSREHYRVLLEIIDTFDKFQFDKETLVGLRNNPATRIYDQQTIQLVIDRNGATRQEYSNRINQIMDYLLCF